MVGSIIWLAVLFALMLAVRVAIILVFDREASDTDRTDPNEGAQVIHRSDWSIEHARDEPDVSPAVNGKDSS